MVNANLNSEPAEYLSLSETSDTNLWTTENACYSKTHNINYSRDNIQPENILMPHFLPMNVSNNEIQCHEATNIINAIKLEVNTNSGQVIHLCCDTESEYQSNETNSTIASETFPSLKYMALNSIRNSDSKIINVADVQDKNNTKNTKTTSNNVKLEVNELENYNFLPNSLTDCFSSESSGTNEGLSCIKANQILDSLSDARECAKDLKTVNEINDKTLSLCLKDEHIINDVNQVDCSTPNLFNITLVNFDENNGFESVYTFVDDPIKDMESIQCDKEFTLPDLVNITSYNFNEYNNYNTLVDEVENVDTESEEVVSVSSISDYCSGYQSSDFEFIDESEANVVMLNYKNISSIKTVKENSNSDFELLHKSNSKDIFDTKLINRVETNEDNNYLNYPNYSFDVLAAHCSSNIKSHNRRNSCIDALQEKENYQSDHVIPEDDDFLTLFQGAHIPIIELHFLENKSIYARNPTPASIKEVGFDIKMLLDGHKQYETHNDVLEAKECEKEILSMYPRHNRKYRRRF